jgi:hypothetical protein
MPIKYAQPDGDGWPISLPIYTPANYWFFALGYEKLPSVACSFLDDLSTKYEFRDLGLYVKNKRRQLAESLQSNLRGNDEGLVRLRHQARRTYIELLSDGFSSESQRRRTRSKKELPVERILEQRRRDGQRLRDVLEQLIRERIGILDDFMTKFDALVWWEMQSVANVMLEASQARHRNAACKPLIDGVNHDLKDLDRTAMGFEDDWMEDEEGKDENAMDCRSVGSSTEEESSSYSGSEDERNPIPPVEIPNSVPPIHASKPMSLREYAARVSCQLI